MADTLMAVFFLILLSDWRNTVVMLVTGAAAAVLLYVSVVPNPVLPVDYVARLPMLVLVVVGGSLFKFAEKQAEAEKVKRTYTALAGSIAHEMRNPLSQIRHNLEGMQQALPPPTTTPQAQTLGAPQVDTLYRHLAESEMAVKRGLQVIAMILDEVSAKPVDTSAFSYLSAAATTEKAVYEYAFASEAERRKVSVHVIEDFDFRVDETAYLFVLFNLIKNALYYMALDPSAGVTVTVGDHHVKVHDTGPGIAPDALAKLFEPFGSVGKAGGTGLGLAYCRRVMRAFGGEIECESVLGEYTQFPALPAGKPAGKWDLPISRSWRARAPPSRASGCSSSTMTPPNARLRATNWRRWECRSTRRPTATGPSRRSPGSATTWFCST